MEEIFENINEGDEYTGVVEKIYPTGAVIRLDNGLTAFALTRQNSDNVHTATHHIYKIGASVKGYISKVDREAFNLNIITQKNKD